MYEFHISRYVRDKHEFALSLFQLSGNVIFANFHAARVFARKMNAKRDLLNFPEKAVKASDLNAMGLIDEIMHAVVERYREEINAEAVQGALAHLETKLGEEAVKRTLKQFTAQFPALKVYRGEQDADAYLAGETAGRANDEIALEEMLMLWLANMNPAFAPFGELFDDRELESQSAYTAVLRELDKYFETQPPFGPENLPLVQLLRLPAIKFPNSLYAQLEFMLSTWSFVMEHFRLRILSGMDFIREENKLPFTGPGPAQVLEFTTGLAGYEEYENYSPDKDWMPKLVLIAKNTFVWLDQLSKQYGREIRRLDEIPDEELEKLGRSGFNGLWLIGLWERSNASQQIKHLCGNPDAVASAYSLYDYQIAHALGGDTAYETLRDRAARYGVRLAADMVPNHTGIYSKWVVEHPEWYIYLDYPPFPSYSFNGVNLSEDPNIGIYLEDHYYSRSDAAVVFKRVDFNSGRTHYIYHGNDGTSMPWNDTAQLNYLNAEAREAVIQTILSVARKFSVIRFDAAMTLAKKHIQRLWFPEPGAGGAIPSRAEHALPRMRFDELIPREFWQEVVDRVAEEVPDTLLLAEAFWMMEGYFVRTLGMHRVYNSAFMNMLRDEKNAEYRQLIKNTLEFDPQILKRYVNFMNNPDEETAVAQFGKDGKYFGVAVLMSTLPGLPMFGHGQVEGFSEKYGMEYQRAYYDETPDQWLVDRHAREVFPLLHKRYLFAGVEHFLLYDFYTESGGVDENVFAYSNRVGEERTLVVYHNKWAETRGWVKSSAAYAVKDGEGNQHLEQRALAEGLDIPNENGLYVIFRDHISGQEYIRHAPDIHRDGLFIELGAFQYRVFWEFRLVQDNEWSHYHLVSEYLNGRGVHDLEAVKKEIILQPVLHPFRELVNSGMFEWVIDNRLAEPGGQVNEDVLDQSEDKLRVLMTAIRDFLQKKGKVAGHVDTVMARLETVLCLPVLADAFPDTKSRKVKAALGLLNEILDEDPVPWAVLLAWVYTHALADVVTDEDPGQLVRSWYDEWMFSKSINKTLKAVGADEETAWKWVALLKQLVLHEEDRFDTSKPKKERASKTLTAWLQDGETQGYLGVHRHNDVVWYSAENLTRLARWFFVIEVVEAATGLDDPADMAEDLGDLAAIVLELEEAMEIAGYQVEPLRRALKV